MTTYAQIFADTINLWRGEGGILAATQHVEMALANADSADRGRLLTLLGCCHKRREAWVKANQCLTEALAASNDPESRAGALCELVDLCVSTHRVEDGMRYGFDLDMLFRSTRDADELRGPYHHNMGRLLTIAGDGSAALPHLKQARDLFHAADKTNESSMVDVSSAKLFQRMGRTDEAEALCRCALSAESPYVLVEANLVLEQIAASKGDLVQAERHIDRATRIHAESIEKRDYRVFLNILLAEADLAERSGETVVARRLRSLVDRRAAAGRINMDEGVTE